MQKQTRKFLIRWAAYILITLAVILICAAPMLGQTPRTESRISSVGKVKQLASGQSANDLDLRMWRFVPREPNGIIIISLMNNTGTLSNVTLEVFETTFPNIRFRGNEDKWIHVEESRGFSTTLCGQSVANTMMTCQVPLRAAAQVAFMYNFSTLTGTDFDVSIVQGKGTVNTVEGKYAPGAVFGVLSNQDQRSNPILLGVVDPSTGTIFVVEGSNSGSNRGRIGTAPSTGTAYVQASTSISGVPGTGPGGNFALATVPLMNAQRMGLGFQYGLGSHFGGISVTDPCRFHQMANSISGGQCYIVNVNETTFGLAVNSDMFNIRRNSTVDDKGFFQYIEISSDTAGVMYGIDIITNDGASCTSLIPQELRDDAFFTSAFVVSNQCGTDPTVSFANFAVIGPLAANTMYRMDFPLSLGGVTTGGFTIRNLMAITTSFAINVVWTEVPGTP